MLAAAAKASTIDHRPSQEEGRYQDEQRDAVLRMLAAYHPSAMAVFGVDFGPTSPQWCCRTAAG